MVVMPPNLLNPWVMLPTLRQTFSWRWCLTEPRFSQESGGAPDVAAESASRNPSSWWCRFCSKDARGSISHSVGLLEVVRVASSFAVQRTGSMKAIGSPPLGLTSRRSIWWLTTSRSWSCFGTSLLGRNASDCCGKPFFGRRRQSS